MILLPPYISREDIHKRLPLIFPDGTSVHIGYVTREIAASTIFTFLYIGAVQGSDRYLAPVHIYRMTDELAKFRDNDTRELYAFNALKRNYNPPGKRWYADNSREPIRDETIREGFVPIGAVLAADIPTTSSKPRYYLQKEFAALFNPMLRDDALTEAIAQWHETFLSVSALTRIRLAKLGRGSMENEVSVRFPNGEIRKLSPGLSSVISKAVIEVFATTFLSDPGVLWLSTSDKKVVARDDEMAAIIGLKIQADKNLPDIILVDLAPAHPLLVFIEVVATDGAVTNRRQEAIYRLTDNAGFDRSQVAFVTVYEDRSGPGFSKTIRNLAWNSYAWFVSEPEKIIHLKENNSFLFELQKQ
jgi:hypothetical protein